ncbi:DTW domain-containing protein [Shewanella nanhaiensis]|uniref:tRNA-uridine aminocarboxypropyltransferase n=1 Tax=Shewanella nanhaiensis TaxID=2864872 RepID=A0ABS7E588_9GAMM|nr:DTW domain-containing protein [Shewanella nanhaiensis]MBW8184841.1 DTW domain-containing protein [Shewanella nanhaiensis]
MKVILLTHEREVSRLTNTGLVALERFPDWCARVIWSRVEPDDEIVDLLSSKRAAVLFPKPVLSKETGDSMVQAPMEELNLYLNEIPEIIIILDAIWQEARKMIRQSPYLATANKYALTQGGDSQFNLRRNQIPGGLCTLECIIQLCHSAKMSEEALELEAAYIALNQR